MTQRVLDVSALPEGTADSRALLWWGNLGMMAIEGTMFAMLIATYLYFRTANIDWPPQTVLNPALQWPTVNLVMLLLSILPMIMADRAALRDDVFTVQIAFAICIAVGIALLVIRWHNMMALGYKWSDHAYGSVVWTIFGMHSFHMIAATAETSLLLFYSLVRPITKKQLLDFRCMAVYWYFVALWWIPFYFIIYIVPYLTRKGPV